MYPIGCPKPEFPIWTSDPRNIRFSWPGDNELASRASPGEINGVPTARFCPSDDSRLLPHNRFQTLLRSLLARP